MQTFIPLPDFQESIKCLDGKRLFKQVVEARQILNTLIKNTGWIHHPAVLQWKGFEGSLINYAYLAAEECIARGINGHGEISKLNKLGIDPENDVPPWFGTEAIHSSHRSKLLCKGYGDVVCAAIKKTLKIKSIDDYLKNSIGKEKNALKYHEIVALDNFYWSFGTEPLSENYYKRYDWLDNPAAEYVWPTKL